MIEWPQISVVFNTDPDPFCNGILHLESRSKGRG